MIKLLRIRTFNKDGKEITFRKPVQEGVVEESVAKFLSNPQHYVNKLPTKEHYNLHYSLGEWGDENGKDFVRQEVVAFDIDGMDIDRKDEYIPVVLDALRVAKEDCTIVCSGNGLHFIINTSRTIEYKEYFDETRQHYKAICLRVDKAMMDNDLYGNCDNSLWNCAKSLRMPATKNIKIKNGKRIEKDCYVIHFSNNIIPYCVKEKSEIPIIEEEDQVSDRAIQLNGIDNGAVLECPFLKHCFDEPDEIVEPQWYAAITILNRLEGGRELIHKMSEGYSGYDEHETDTKIQHATQTSRPRTCANISTLWDGCASCDKKCSSPIMLKGATFIATKESGFYDVIIGPNGIPRQGKPNYDDLMLYFKEVYKYKVINRNIFIYDGTNWKDTELDFAKFFAEENFRPSPTTQMCKEFEEKLLRQRDAVTGADFFDTAGLVNFKNGYLDTNTGKLHSSDPSIGFTYTLPFDYDPNATSPTFHKYLEDVTSGRQDIKQILLEFAGAVVSAADSRIDPKALILVGHGSNGKSVYTDIIKEVVGSKNFSSTQLREALRKPEARVNMRGKLVNITDETPVKTFDDSSVFKEMVTGGEIESRALYKQSVSFKNTAKLIMSCNTLPENKDLSFGMRRRLLIIDFREEFTVANGRRDPYILDKLKGELAGIWNECFKAFLAMKDRGYYTPSADVDSVVDDFISNSDAALPKEWFEDQDRFKLNDSSFVAINDLYDDYRIYAEESGVRFPETKRSFISTLRDIYKLPKATQKKVGGKNIRIQRGIVEVGREMEEDNAF